MAQNKDLLTPEQQRLGGLLQQSPTIIDPGWWHYAPVGAPEPDYTVERGVFVDSWNKVHWHELGPCGAVVLSEPGSTNAVLLIPSWKDGFNRLQLIMPKYFALGWE